MKTARIAIGIVALIAINVGCRRASLEEPVTLTIPRGFEGPTQQQKDGATVVGFAKQRADSRMNTVLQISLYDFGIKLAELKDTERAAAAAKYLLYFIGGVERRRANFKRTEPVGLTLAGIPAARLEWTGLLESSKTVGVMYCFVVGTKVISFHTQDLGSQPTAAMIEAMRAIEAVRLKKGG